MRKSGIIVSLTAIVLCVILITGSTFSLFTGGTNADISISAGQIKVDANIENLKLSSLGVEQTGDKFANGGTAKLNSNKLDLSNVTPGDRAEFDIIVKNTSSVSISYAITWAIAGELATYLNVTVDGAPFANGTSDWNEWLLEDVAEPVTHRIAVELPKNIGNEAMSLTATIDFDLAAVQYNAIDETVQSGDQLELAITYGDRAILASDVTLKEDLVIPAGKTFTIYLGSYSINTNGFEIINNGTLIIEDNAPQATVYSMRRAASAAGSILGTIVNNGTLTVTENTTIETIENVGTATIEGATVATVNNAGTATIAGATITAIDNTAEAAKLVITGEAVVESITADKQADITISDGSFGFDVPNEWMEEGLGATEDENGNFVIAPATVMIGEKGFVTFADAAAKAAAGDTITLLEDQTMSANVTVPSGVTIDADGKSITGATIYADGDLTFVDHVKVTNFNAGYNKGTINITKGACLELVGTGRMVIGHGATFNIEGEIADAKTADKATVTPSLIMPGASFTGAGVTFNVKNAYVKVPSSYASTSSSASGTFNFSIENSIWESAGKLAFEASSPVDAVNFELKNSVLTTGSHLVFGASNGEIVIDNSTVNEGVYRQLENRGTMTIKNGSVVYASVQVSSNAWNCGKTVVDNSTYITTGEFSGSTSGIIGTLEIRNGATAVVPAFSNANVIVDTESSLTFKNIKAGATLTLDAANWNGKKALVFPGLTAIPNCEIVNSKLEPIFKVVDGGVAFMNTPKGSVTPAFTSGNSFWGEGGGNATESLVISIYEGEKVIATASLNNIDGILNGNVYVTWNIPFAGSNDEYWNVTWAENYPNIEMNPTKVTIAIDGTVVAENNHQWNGPDDLNKIVALAEKNGKFLGAYTKLADAMGKFNGRTVNVLCDINESITGFYGVELMTTAEGGVTITSPFSEDWIDFDDVTVRSGVTLDIDNAYSGDSENVIEGTVLIRDMLYHAYNAKTTIQNGGSLRVTGSTVLRYNSKADAGIYVYGDGDNSTVEYFCGYYIGAYSGTLYAENANIEAGYFLLKNSYDNASYADIALTLDNSTLAVVGAKDGQDSFIIDDKASITMKNGSAIKDVRDFNVLAGTVLTLNVDETSYFELTNVNFANGLPFTYEKDENGKVTITNTGLFKDDATNTYYVYTAEGFMKIHDLFANYKAGRNANICIMVDLDMAGYVWTTVDSHVDFNSCISSINGNGHTIKNLTINGQAMFRRFAGSGNVVIKDLTFDFATVNSNGNINTSILCGQTYQNVLLDNVDVKNSTINGGYKVAPLIATVYNESTSTITATLKNCDVSNTTVIATSYDFCTTGMVAFVYADDNDKIEFENCTVTNVAIYAPNVYSAHAWVYTTGSSTLYNEVEGVTVSGCTFENI